MGGSRRSKVDQKTRQEQLALERERLELERQAAADRTNELSLLRQQVDQQTQAYNAQYSLLQQQSAETGQRALEYQKLLEGINAASDQQASLALYDRTRQQLLSDEYAQSIGLQTGLISNSVLNRGKLHDKKRQQATPSYTQAEKRSLLSGEAKPR
jgi:hypothetical protein